MRHLEERSAIVGDRGACNALNVNHIPALTFDSIMGAGDPASLHHFVNDRAQLFVTPGNQSQAAAVSVRLDRLGVVVRWVGELLDRGRR